MLSRDTHQQDNIDTHQNILPMQHGGQPFLGRGAGRVGVSQHHKLVPRDTLLNVSTQTITKTVKI